MNISRVIKESVAFAKKWVMLKKEEIDIKSEIFKIDDISQYDEELFRKYAEMIVKNNKLKKENKLRFKEAFGEFKDDTYYAAQRKLGNIETEYEETPSFRDEPEEIEKINKDVQLELQGLPKDFRKKMNSDKTIANTQEEIEDMAEENVVIEDIKIEEASEEIKDEEGGFEVSQELKEEEKEIEIEERDEVEEMREEEKEIEIEEGDEVEEIEAEERNEKAELKEEDGQEIEEGQSQEDLRHEKAKQIIESINEESIKFSTKRGKELKAELEGLGYRLDIHYEKDKETKLWELR